MVPEPLSLAVAITGLVAGVRTITSYLSEALRDARHGKEALEDIRSLLTGFANACESVTTLLSTLPGQITAAISRRDPDFWRNLETTVEGFQSKLQRVQDTVHEVSSDAAPAATATELQWNSREINSLRELSRDMLTHTHVILTVLNT